MSELFLHHALIARKNSGETKILAESNELPEAWCVEVEKLCAASGVVNVDADASPAIFARPLGKRNVAVVRANYQPQSSSVICYVLVFPVQIYRATGGDPFFLADALPPLWNAEEIGPPRVWDAEASPYRPFAEIQGILKSSDGPTLLGATQALLDGAKVVFERPTPNEELVRQIWQLLPTSSRSELWPCTFDVDGTFPFHVAVAPKVDEDGYVGYWRETQVGDYPEGRYELRLQTAVEAGDQAEVDKLFARRSSRETFRLGLLILAIAMMLPILSGLLGQLGPQKKEQEPKETKPPTTAPSTQPTERKDR